MAAHTVPELAISESSDTSSAAYHEVAYDPMTSGPWVDDEEDDQTEVATMDEAEVVPPPMVTPWNASGWDDTAFVHVWAAAKEEYMVSAVPTAAGSSGRLLSEQAS